MQHQFFQQGGDYRLSKYSDIELNGKIPDSAFKLKSNGKTTFQKMSLKIRAWYRLFFQGKLGVENRDGNDILWLMNGGRSLLPGAGLSAQVIHGKSIYDSCTP